MEKLTAHEIEKMFSMASSFTRNQRIIRQADNKRLRNIDRLVANRSFRWVGWDEFCEEFE